ncbi:MAG: polysaccharide deacetylase family protein [Bernardetiaceae bacterium]|jgi:peptidoglycan/xylan/chitin deacetylase (PgdA/CDA1 family)|nr:polysaccharide deacetylase family protein [Bernardetiaceae bacterium]
MKNWLTSVVQFSSLLGLLLCNWSAHAQKQIAITIDDPNVQPTPKLTWQVRDSAILAALDHHRIKAALFVCGMRVSNPNGRALLAKWDQQQHLICNHSYSHLYFDANTQTADRFIADFVKGDSVVKPYKYHTKRFRYPYLKEGNTAAKRDSLRDALASHGYQNGGVTVDASDWYIDAEMAKALKNDPGTDLTPYKEYYLAHMLDRLLYYDSLAHLVFKRDIKHTLLIHHSLLNALFLNDLLAAIKAQGWQLIDARQAYEDEVFTRQPALVPCGESVVWQGAKLDERLASSLRYPAEDAKYEQAALSRQIKKYLSRKQTRE